MEEGLSVLPLTSNNPLPLSADSFDIYVIPLDFLVVNFYLYITHSDLNLLKRF